MESTNHSYSTKVLCGWDNAPILFLSEKGELLKLVDEDEHEAVEALCGKIIVDFVRNEDRVVVLTDEGAVYIWW